MSAAARWTASPASVVERLAPVERSYGREARVGAAHRHLLGRSTPISSAAIWANAVRGPCPISVVPTRTTTRPSASRRHDGARDRVRAGGEQPDGDARGPTCGGFGLVPADRRRDLLDVADRGPRRAAFRPRAPPRRACRGSARRTSSGSSPARRATSSTWSSPIHCRCVAPKARYEPGGRGVRVDARGVDPEGRPAVRPRRGIAAGRRRRAGRCRRRRRCRTSTRRRGRADGPRAVAAVRIRQRMLCRRVVTIDSETRFWIRTGPPGLARERDRERLHLRVRLRAEAAAEVRHLDAHVRDAAPRRGRRSRRARGTGAGTSPRA